MALAQPALFFMVVPQAHYLLPEVQPQPEAPELQGRQREQVQPQEARRQQLQRQNRPS
jgi:hypothetical protein